MSGSSHRLLTDIETFMAAHAISETNFGVASVNDGHLVRDLRGGRQITLATADRIREFMSSYSTHKPRARRRSRGAAAAA